MDDLLPNLAAAAQSPVGSGIRRAVAYYAILCLLIIIVLLGVLVLLARNRARIRQGINRKTKPPFATPIDPWVESGRRLGLPPEGDSSPDPRA
ncbi:MAG: hypothetical protein JNM07_06740 [Phycisphaerae bacterium]|nr:hypothetical protein [Phycisphaerae bacterium]